MPIPIFVAKITSINSTSIPNIKFFKTTHNNSPFDSIIYIIVTIWFYIYTLLIPPISDFTIFLLRNIPVRSMTLRLIRLYIPRRQSRNSFPTNYYSTHSADFPLRNKWFQDYCNHRMRHSRY